MARVALDTKQTGNQRCPKLSRCSLVGDQGCTPTKHPKLLGWSKSPRTSVFDEKRQCQIFWDLRSSDISTSISGYFRQRGTAIALHGFIAVRISLRRLSIAEPVGTSKIISQIAARQSCLS